MPEQLTFDEFTHFFTVRLDQFDGPIDLLLHLVKQNELEIEKLSLARVTEQYLGCLERARDIDLEIAGEYLVIAATLISIKASVLLNEPVQLVEDEDGNLVDPHEELLERLREAEVYKEGARMLGARDFLGLDVFAKPPSLRGLPTPPIKYKEHDPILLGKAFKQLIDQAGADSRLYTVTLESVSVVEIMMSALDRLRHLGHEIAFVDLVPDTTSVMSILGTFIAMLELCKRQVIVVRQEGQYGDITVGLAVDDFDGRELTSEFDGHDQEVLGGQVELSANA